MKVKDLFSGEVFHLPSMLSAGQQFEVSASHVHQALSTSVKTRLFKKKYLVVKEDEEFPDVTPEEFDVLLNPGGREVVAYNVSVKNYFIHSSAADFIRTHGLSRKAVTVTLARQSLRKIGDWYMVYNRPELVEQLKSLVKCPDSQGK